MKIRCVHNSIRLRLKKSEVDSLKLTGEITESVAFPGSDTFRYKLSIIDNLDSITPQFLNNEIRIQLPRTLTNDWMNSNDVGIEKEVQLENSEMLNISIEKDFPCLDRPNEDKSDTFWELVPEQPDNC